MKSTKLQQFQKITPFLWFDGQAEQAAKFYISIFGKSKILKIARVTEQAAKQIGKPEGSVLTVEFELEGQRFVALNGGPMFKFNEAVSFVVNCKTQAEVDKYWDKLSAGGEKSECGWVKDKFGVSWQITPTILPELLSGKDTAKAGRVIQAMLQMSKLDIKALKAAANAV
ncbi:MAG TPA: VOC family protein [Verrucomicrobiae bacterium]|jgi:predicted 3-demethylubiquinone-9 3-methyltransferase (glyoxalase superfamily)|nr:VOC family protein [Verrucomicrobiae bacterium]